MERHAELLGRALGAPGVALKTLGETLDGQPLDLLRFGTPGAPPCWIVGRQHPGETMAEWWMEGFLDRLLDARDALGRALCAKACFHVVPNMNPDGSRRGHLRTNAAGVNLNREWLEPSAERSPEVLLVRRRMAESGVDFCLDVHGDEALPYNFIAGPEGVPGYSARQAELLGRYKAALESADPPPRRARSE